jgi:peptide deformylase
MKYRIIPHEKNPALRNIARHIPVADITSKHIQHLITEMKKLLAVEEHGVAIAAPQVGESIQLFIVSGNALQKRDEKYIDEASSAMATIDHVYINPTLPKMSRGKRNKHEGCLSIRGLWGMVPRAEKVTLTYYDEHGKKLTRGASGFLAHIFQHEMDHLQGVLYTDKAVELHEDTEDTQHE